MSSYNSIDDAYVSAKETVESIAESRDWSSAQKATALNDVKQAYDEANSISGNVSAFVGSLSFDNVIDNAFTFGETLNTAAQIELCNSFWSNLRNRSGGWASYPGYDKVAAWLGSSVTAAKSALVAHEESSKTGAIVDGASETGKDYTEIATTAGKVATDPKTWYLIGAAAVLGAFVYVRGIFR